MTEQWEPCESRDSRTVLRAAEGEVPSAYSPAAADRAVGVRLMETRSRNEDEKLSTKAGQLHCSRTPDSETVPTAAVSPSAEKTDRFVAARNLSTDFASL